MNPPVIAISRRQKRVGPNHHLWNNHGTWWLHCTLHLPDFTKWRLRRNLRTSDVHEARQFRDRILAGIDAPAGNLSPSPSDTPVPAIPV